MKPNTILLIALTALALSGCSSSRIDQDSICDIRPDAGEQAQSLKEQFRKCSAGDIISLQPTRWGNEQMPLVFASAVCDFNFPIVYNPSGVTCVFTDRRAALW